jgi:F-type H+-transporting ATPase subunit alpha
MKQNQYAPLSVADMAVSLFAVEKGFLKDVELNKILDFEAALQSYMNSEKTDLMNSINETGDYNKDIEAKLNDALTAFKSTQTW